MQHQGQGRMHSKQTGRQSPTQLFHKIPSIEIRPENRMESLRSVGLPRNERDNGSLVDLASKDLLSASGTR